MMSRSLQKETSRSFKGKGYKLQFGDGYVTIIRKDGVNCEFCTCAETSYDCYLTGNYFVFGEHKEIDLHLPSEMDEFVQYVDDILSYKHIPQRK